MLIFIVPSQAQILRNIARSAINSAKNSAEDRVEEEVDKKVENEVNKLFDKALEKDSDSEENEGTKDGSATSKPDNDEGSSTNNESQDMSKFMKKLGVSTEDVKYKESYKFNSQIVTEIIVTDEDGKKADPSEYVMGFNESTSDIMMKMNGQGNSTTTIFDTENFCMLMLTDSEGKKSGFASKFDPNAKVPQGGQTPESNSTEDETEECKMTKTGNSKTISGYSCKEYRCETSDEISIAWVTKDISASNNKMFKNSTFGSSFVTDGFDGMVIQYEFKSKKDKSATVTTVKSIDMNKQSSFSTKGYSISSFSFAPGK